MVNQVWKNIESHKKVFIIAEAGVNHNGSLNRAKQLVDVALRAEADAVKFQTFKTERLVTIRTPKAEYQKKNTQPAESQYQMLKKLELKPSDFEKIFAYCQKRKIMFMSTPFDEKSADFLFKMGMEIFKIPSGEITNLPFVQYIARKNRPLIVSTGMSNLKEVREAVLAIRETGNSRVALLHCVSSYPADPGDVNLKVMETMEREFKIPIGFSDHTFGIVIAVAAVALGAKVLEKHFTLNRHLLGPDHKASLEPQELLHLVKAIRQVEMAMGDGLKRPVPGERNILQVARRSLVAACDIQRGTILSQEHITDKRPGTGLSPTMRNSLLGRMARVPISKDEILTREMFA